MGAAELGLPSNARLRLLQQPKTKAGNTCIPKTKMSELILDLSVSKVLFPVVHNKM